MYLPVWKGTKVPKYQVAVDGERRRHRSRWHLGVDTGDARTEPTAGTGQERVCWVVRCIVRLKFGSRCRYDGGGGGGGGGGSRRAGSDGLSAHVTSKQSTKHGD